MRAETQMYIAREDVLISLFLFLNNKEVMLKSFSSLLMSLFGTNSMLKSLRNLKIYHETDMNIPAVYAPGSAYVD